LLLYLQAGAILGCTKNASYVHEDVKGRKDLFERGCTRAQNCKKSWGTR